MKHKIEREELLECLRNYGHSKYIWDEERQNLERLQKFIAIEENAFERSHPEGHVTASALIVNKNFTKVLLTLHKKLGMWLQLGGHSDGHPIPHEVALKEAREESGLTHFSFISLSAEGGAKVILPWDVDIHRIPDRPGEPSHDHYDIRFGFVALDERAPTISEESTDLKWWTMEEALELCPDQSMQRLLRKGDALRLSNLKDNGISQDKRRRWFF